MTRLPEEAATRCPNRSCPAQIKEGLRHFASRGGLDIRGLGEKLVDRLVEIGRVKDLADLFDLTTADLVSLERLGEKSAANLMRALKTSLGRPLPRLLTALGIRHVGSRVAELLAERFGIVLDSEQVETLGGYLSDMAGRVPRQGDSFQAAGHAFTIAEADKRQVRWVVAEPLPEGVVEDDSELPA